MLGEQNVLVHFTTLLQLLRKKRKVNDQSNQKI